MGNKLALIIGTNEYLDSGLTQLKAPDADVHALAEILRRPDIGEFDEVSELRDPLVSDARLTIARFFADKHKDDLLLLYFSGHGFLDDWGNLYLAVRDTQRKYPKATALEASFITHEMDVTNSRRQILILDCCHSGAFAHGAKGVNTDVGTAAAFEGTGYGRVVLTASDATQYAWEGDQVTGQPQHSVFTHSLIEGLRTGEADTDEDGHITIDELYGYVYDRVVNQKKSKSPVSGATSSRARSSLRKTRRLSSGLPLSRKSCVRRSPLPSPGYDWARLRNLVVFSPAHIQGWRSLPNRLYSSFKTMTAAGWPRLRPRH